MPSNCPECYYLTTPIYYINAVPHIGHAYTTILADTVARFQRMCGREVLFATGTDEHAEKVARVALERGLTPRQYSDELADKWRETWCRLDITFDDFIRTPEERHRRAVQEVVRRLSHSGDIYPGEYEGWYCVPCATFLLESDLVNGNCPNSECGRPVEPRKQPAYYFAASRYSERLLAHIGKNPDFIVPDFRRNEVVSFIEGGMRDACISRPNDGWGIPWPDDDSQVVYVWFDALINYITVPGWPDDIERFNRFWPADLHLMAKDILPRFHGSMWPALLMALGLPLPKRVAAHGYWQMEGSKISKSIGNVVDPFSLAEALQRETGIAFDIGLDAVRYFLLRETQFGQDAAFSDEALTGRLNSDLANDLGNALNRALPLVERHFEGVVPDGRMAPDLGEAAIDTARAVAGCLEGLDFRSALERVWELLSRVNKYIDTAAPWALAREVERRQELANVLYTVLETIRCVTVVLYPFIPHAAAEMRHQLGLSPVPEGLWDALTRPGEESLAGRRVDRGAPVFPRVDRAALKAKTQPKEMPTVDTISYEDFAKIELRVATVEAGERVPNADKLYKLSLDLGNEKRAIVAGLAQDFQLEDLVGRQVVIVANLEPRKVRGVVSQGMLLAACDATSDRPVAVITVDRPAPAGAGIR